MFACQQNGTGAKSQLKKIHFFTDRLPATTSQAEYIINVFLNIFLYKAEIHLKSVIDTHK